jgi:hypothetical protein
MEPWIDKLKSRWLYTLGAVALTSLFIGVGIGTISGGVARIESFLQSGNAAAQEFKPITTPQGLPNFVALAKDVKP